MTTSNQLMTTLALARQARVDREQYEKMARAVGGVRKYGQNTPLSLCQVLDSNGLNYALLCFQCVLPAQRQEADRIQLLFLADVLERVLPRMRDKRSRAVVPHLRRQAMGRTTVEETARVWDAAREASYAADLATIVDSSSHASRAAAYASHAASYAAPRAAAAYVLPAAYDAVAAATNAASVAHTVYAARVSRAVYDEALAYNIDPFAAAAAANAVAEPARRAETDWQTTRLRWYLTGRAVS